MSNLGAKSTEHKAVRSASDKALAAKKAAENKAVADKKIEQIKQNIANQYVYFAVGKKAGNFVFDSPDVVPVALENGKTHLNRIPSVELTFGDDGTTQPLDPRVENDVVLIERAREVLARHFDPNDPFRDARIDEYKLREITPDSTRPPVANWDSTDPAKLPEVAQLLGLDIEQCIQYELEKPKSEQRATLIRDLRRLLEFVEEDPLSTVEVA